VYANIIHTTYTYIYNNNTNYNISVFSVHILVYYISSVGCRYKYQIINNNSNNNIEGCRYSINRNHRGERNRRRKDYEAPPMNESQTARRRVKLINANKWIRIANNQYIRI